MNEKNITKYTGAIKGKVPLSGLSAKYRSAYVAIALIHHFGAEKYGYYSWYNDPLNCNSSVSDNIDAIFRHMTAHRIGKTVDSESGLPHIFHACCRAGMLITIYYRNDTDDDFIEKKNENAKLDVVSQLTTEELLVLSKDRLVPTYDDLNELSDHIFEILCAFDMFEACYVPGITLDDTYYSRVEDLVLSIWRYLNALIAANKLAAYNITGMNDAIHKFFYQYGQFIINQKEKNTGEVWTAQI
jgi:hypothetical protein